MCWDCYDNRKGDPYKIFTQGGVEVSDFDDEIPYRHPKRRQKKEKPRRRGCPENNGGAHVYIWQEVKTKYRRWDGTLVDWNYKEKICCGCDHVNNRVYSWSRRYKDIEV